MLLPPSTWVGLFSVTFFYGVCSESSLKSFDFFLRLPSQSYSFVAIGDLLLRVHCFV